MSFGTWIAIGIVFFITYAVSDWLADKTFKLIKKTVAKRREKRFVKYVKPLDYTSPLPVEELFKKD